MTSAKNTRLAAETATDPRWTAVLTRDAAADGTFVYSVETTGVYCNPSCGARPARPEHVRFHATVEAAARAGFRPCKRCKPDQRKPEIRFALGASSLGSILVAKSERGVCAILLGDDALSLPGDLRERFPRAKLIGAEAELEQVVAQVVELVEAPTRGLDVILDPRGTAFQQRVWRALGAIPAGETASYTEVAKRIGAPASARAVAQACAANALAVAIPCHRVVRNDGALSGYRWGVERKRALLEREAQT